MVESSMLTVASHNSIARATVKMPGTCGELVQGMIGGVTFHISCPIDIFSTVTVNITDTTNEWVFQPQFPKAAAATKAVLACFGLTGLGGCLCIESALPRGKGMASSTADVAGAIYAVARAFDRDITSAEVARLALSIEPTDGSIFPNIVLFDHVHGSKYEDLGPAPPLDIIVLDFGGEVDTILFNRQDRTEALIRIEPLVTEAVALARKGLQSGDLQLIGKAATISSLANQSILYKPQLDRALHLALEAGAVGVNVGHSGTVLGVLVDSSQVCAADVAAELTKGLPEVERLSVCRLIGGGFRYA